MVKENTRISLEADKDSGSVTLYASDFNCKEKKYPILSITIRGSIFIHKYSEDNCPLIEMGFKMVSRTNLLRVDVL